MVTSFPTDDYAILHYNMIRAHYTFTVGYDSILKHLDTVAPHELKDFLGYCYAWAYAISEHHDSEEAVVFPVLKQKLDISHEVESHRIIHTDLEEVIRFINGAQKKPNIFDADKLREMMEKLREPLFNHLDEEVEDIQAEKLRVFDKETIGKLNKDFLKYVQSHGDPTLLVPFMMTHTPPEWQAIWPNGMPWLVRKLIVPLLAFRHRKCWKYSPYGLVGIFGTWVF